MAIESLAQQASTFVDSLSVKPSATEQSEKDVAQEAAIPEQGDTVSISEEARALVAIDIAGQSKETDEDSDTNQTLKNQIKTLEQEIKDLEKSDLPEDQKTSQLMDKETQLMELRDQLLKAQQAELKASGLSAAGGTRANGFGNSAETFQPACGQQTKRCGRLLPAAAFDEHLDSRRMKLKTIFPALASYFVHSHE